MAVASVVTSLAALVSADPAGAVALGRSDDFSFTASSTGARVTCTITSFHDYGVGDDPELATAETQVVSGPAPCFNYFDAAEVRATFRQPDGQRVSQPAHVGNGGYVKGTFRPVGSELATFHRVRFEDCASACTTPEYRLPSSK